MVTDVHGRLVAVGRAFPGSRHDARRVEEAGFREVLSAGGGGVGDAGYQGCGLLSPLKKQPGTDRSEHDEELSTSLARIRAAVEWGIAHLKNWHILATRYRGDLHRVDTVIQAGAGVQLLNEQLTERTPVFQVWPSGS